RCHAAGPPGKVASISTLVNILSGSSFTAGGATILVPFSSVGGAIIPISLVPSTVFTSSFASSICFISGGGLITSSSFTTLGGVNWIVATGGGGGNLGGGGGGGGGGSSGFICCSVTSDVFIFKASSSLFNLDAIAEPTSIKTINNTVPINALVILLL